MVDRIQKILNKISPKEKSELLAIAQDIERENVAQYDIKKLKGFDDIYRIRKGKFRLIYRVESPGRNKVLAIERRNDNTYKF